MEQPGQRIPETHINPPRQDKKKKKKKMNGHKNTASLLSRWESQAEEQQPQRHYDGDDDDDDGDDERQQQRQHLAWHELGRARRQLSGQEEARVKSQQAAALARFVAASRHRSFGRKA